MKQSRENKSIRWFFLRWGGMEGVFRKALIEKGAQSTEGRVSVYYVEMEGKNIASRRTA